MDADRRKLLNDFFERVIGCAFEVSNILGPGFLEVVYRRALAHEPRLAGIDAQEESRVLVKDKGVVVGEYYVDIVVKGELVPELKCVVGIANEHLAQTLNYLKATGHHLALISTF